MKLVIKFFANINILVGLVLMTLPIAYLVAINTPQVWYRINPNAVEDEIRALTRDPFADTFGSIDLIPKVYAEAPKKNDSLPRQNSLRINKIGVNTQIREGENEEAALAKGVWRMPDFGSPKNNDKPIILSAHRWGPLSITAEYRQQNMFINLPKIKPGDKIEIVWDQQLYTYEVVESEINEHVTQLNDLILITCQYYDSPERIIVYANRVR